MQRLLKDLEDLSFDDQDKNKLREMEAHIRDCIDVAEQGDRPKAFAKAIPVIEQIRADNPLFDKISSEAASQAIRELRGLIEFYAEVAQMN